MSDRKPITLADAYEQYMAANINMKPLGRDHWHRRWPLISPVFGHLYLDEVTTLEMDKLKQSLPAHYAPSTVNHHLALVRAVLGHRSAQSTEVFAHLGSKAQLRLVRALEPASPPHRGEYLVNERRTRKLS